MILADSDILGYIKKKQLIVENFDEGNLTPNGYDLTVGEILVPALGTRASKGAVKLPTLTWFLIGTREVVELPRGITGQLWIRTSWARKGIMSSFGKVDAGFRGNLTLSAFNASPGTVEISAGDRFAQIVFIRTSREAEKDYQERSGNYQDERGITLEPRKKSS
ncbi:MAG: dCTP deaminase [Thermoplasmata archaeon]